MKRIEEDFCVLNKVPISNEKENKIKKPKKEKKLKLLPNIDVNGLSEKTEDIKAESKTKKIERNKIFCGKLKLLFLSQLIDQNNKTTSTTPNKIPSFKFSIEKILLE